MKNEGLLKKCLIYGILLFRLFLLMALLVSWVNFRITPAEGRTLLAVIMPMSLLYLVLAIKYTLTNHRYFSPGKVLTASYFFVAMLPLLALHLAELLLVGLKGMLSALNGETVLLWTAGLESLLAVYAGYFLSGLFTQVNPDA